MTAKRVCLALSLLLTLASAKAQNYRQPVKFACQCNDQSGSLFSTALRDLLATSPRFIESSDSSEKGADGKVTMLHWQIRVISMDPSSVNNGNATVLAAVLLLGDAIYESQEVQWCPRSDVNSCARTTLSFLDREINTQ